MPRRIVLKSIPASLSVMVILAVASFFTGQANAQVSGATLSGTVNDPSGAVIAGARVAIANKDTGVSRTVTTDSAGLYSAPNLLPGPYEVTITATGFSTTKESNITLTVGAQQTLNVALKIGEAAQTRRCSTARRPYRAPSRACSRRMRTSEISRFDTCIVDLAQVPVASREARHDE